VTDVFPLDPVLPVVGFSGPDPTSVMVAEQIDPD
jgi:hypothetical protein